MTQFDSGRENGHESINLEPRTECALTECMTVLPDAPGLYTVVGENGNESYTVDARAGVCSCKDFEYREPVGGCKHIRRCRFATGARPIPASVDGVDSLLGVQTDETPRRAASDDGVVRTTDATREQLAELREYDLAVRSEDGEPVPWDAINNPDEPESTCQHVVRDREQRVDDGTLMADRPPVAIFTIEEDAGEIVRVEYYWGHDRLGLEYDLRADPDGDPEPTLGGDGSDT